MARVSFAALDASTFDLAAAADLGVIAMSGDDDIAVDVATEVESILASEDYAQFRTTFGMATNGDDSTDLMFLVNPTLEVVVHIE